MIFKLPVEKFTRERNALRGDIEAHGFNKKLGCYTGVFNGDTVDASLLLLPRCGYVDYRDDRMRGTWRVIQDTIESDGADPPLSRCIRRQRAGRGGIRYL